jgi:hypothetical protein
MRSPTRHSELLPGFSVVADKVGIQTEIAYQHISTGMDIENRLALELWGMVR